MPQPRDNTAKLAKELWTAEALDLSPDEFQSRFDAIYSAVEGPATLWQLGGAANDYLRARPGSIVVPQELPPKLASSEMVDARIIGLKLMVRCSPDLGAIVALICRALESRRESELYGGLCELDNLLRRLGPAAGLQIDELLARMGKLNSSSDRYVRETAARLSAWLRDFAAAQVFVLTDDGTRER
jgi:hypothetical protein